MLHQESIRDANRDDHPRWQKDVGHRVKNASQHYCGFLMWFVHSKPNNMKPGSLLICVNDVFNSDDQSYFNAPLPVKNKLYVLRALIPNESVENGPDGVALEEIYGKLSTFKNYAGRWVTIEQSFKMVRFKEVLPPLDVRALIEHQEESPEVVEL